MFEHKKGYFGHSKMWGWGGGEGQYRKLVLVGKFTPLYEKGIKKLGKGQWRLL